MLIGPLYNLYNLKPKRLKPSIMEGFFIGMVGLGEVMYGDGKVITCREYEDCKILGYLAGLVGETSRSNPYLHTGGFDRWTGWMDGWVRGHREWAEAEEEVRYEDTLFEPRQ